MQVLKVDSEITVLYKIIITVFIIIKIHLLFLAPLYTFLCVLNKHHCSRFLYSTWRIQRGGLCPLCRLTPLPPIHPPLPRFQNVLHLCSVTWLSHVVRALQGQQVFSWVTRTYMERHVCYTISYSKLACGIEKGGGLEMGFGGTQNVST